jgi:tetratricopeptide (TPR) repeat protein
MARYALGDLEGAISDLDIAIAIAFDPGYAAALYNRGRAQHDKRNLDHAIEDYSRAIAIDPRLAQAYNTLSANCLSSPLVGASMPKSACTRVKIVFT